MTPSPQPHNPLPERLLKPGRLCGAWSLSGEPLESLICELRRRAASADRAAGASDEFVAGRLWLRADFGALARREGRTAAWDGFLSPGADGPWTLSPAAGAGVRWKEAPAGHYVAVEAAPERGALVLRRDPGGGERLYFCVEGGLLLFASSLKVLLALRGRATVLDGELAFERGLAELACFGDRTLVEGVREVLPGHRLAVDGAALRQDWAWDGLLEPPEGDVASLAPRLREALKESVARCLGGDGKAAVAVSGGVDSASVAALAVELLGPERVSAFTYEYQDPEHPSEVPAAAEICRRLGIGAHRVIAITFEDFADAAPEAVWLAEDPGYWKRSYPLALARAAAAAGFDKFLTGFGIGSHMGWLEECACALRWLPAPQWTLRGWTAPHGPLAAALRGLHPGLAAPMHRLFYPTLALLRARGVLRDLRPFFPPPLGERVEEALRSPRVRGELDAMAALPLARQLQFLSFAHMNSCSDVARCERVSREAGAVWLAPAHLPSCLPYCYLPPRVALSLWDPRRRLRPGKLLLLEAMGEALPKELRSCRKNWAQTIGSRRWRDRVLARMDAAAGTSWEDLRAVFGDAFEPAKRWAPEGMIPLAFWHRLFVAGRFERTPSWRELACAAARP